jgi:hypothetical protein
MISIKFDDKIFFKDLMNITGYSEGFLQGAVLGNKKLSDGVANSAVEIFKNFVDQQARVDQQMYHHIYEWYQVGNPGARLFDINYIVREGGISFNGTFTQSISVSNGSNQPFYDKAKIMERGLPVTISPTNASVLTFNVDGEQVFTPNAVTIEHPGGTHVMGSFERLFDLFFKEHFRQSVLDLTGITQHLSNAKAYKDNFKAGKTGGKAKGIEVGYNWIAKAGDLSV